MQRKWILIIIIHCFYSLFSQNKKNIDSLNKIIKLSDSDTLKIKALNSLAKEYWLFKPDSAIPILESAYSLACKINNPKFISATLIYKAYSYSNKNNYDSSIALYTLALKVSEINHLEKNRAGALTGLGNIFNIMGDYDKASGYYIQALKIQEANKDQIGIAKTYNSLGSLFDLQENYPKAIDYYTRSLKIKSQLKDKIAQSLSYNNLGSCYQSLKKYKQAIEHYEKAMEISEELNDLTGMARTYNNLANTYNYTDIQNAIPYHKKALELYSQMNDLTGKANTNFNLAMDYLNVKKYELGFFYLKKSESLANQLELKSLERDIYRSFYKFYSEQKNYQAALEYSLKYIDINDSLYSESKAKVINEINTKYETEKKEKENQLLNIQAKLSSETINRQKIISYFIITALLLTLTLVFFIFKSFKNQREANRIISQQKNIVEEHQKEILDSIHYAKRIQQSLMPTEVYITKILNRLNANK